MGIIEHTIDFYLKNDLVNNVAITGLDKSGKTTMILGLAGKWKTMKFNSVTPPYMDMDIINSVKIFDRLPVIDYYVYSDHSDNKDYKSVYFKYMERIIREKLPKTLFVIYLHDMFLYTANGTEPAIVYEKRDLIVTRFIEVIGLLNKMKVPMIIITEDSFKMVNGVYGF